MTKIAKLQDYHDALDICAGDCCMSAVRRAYAELCDTGAADTAAFDVALTVFKWHHPETNLTDAATIVRGWVRQGAEH
ncbi:MAG: hypothetical protein WDO70_12085 [Alphaproteobacteria bacterium]